MQAADAVAGSGQLPANLRAVRGVGGGPVGCLARTRVVRLSLTCESLM